jgi:Arc/MetJ family transcription regulator
MSRTTVTLDDDLLQDARRLLGTSGISDTVNAALAVAVRQARLAAWRMAAHLAVVRRPTRTARLLCRVPASQRSVFGQCRPT